MRFVYTRNTLQYSTVGEGKTKKEEKHREIWACARWVLFEHARFPLVSLVIAFPFFERGAPLVQQCVAVVIVIVGRAYTQKGIYVIVVVLVQNR